MRTNKFANLYDFSLEDINHIFDISRKFRENSSSLSLNSFKNKNMLLLFEVDNVKLRAIVSSVCLEFGINVTYIKSLDGFSAVDNVKTFDRIFDGVCYYGNDRNFEILCDNLSIPVFCIGTLMKNPLKALTLMLVIRDSVGDIKNKNLTYVGNLEEGVSLSFIELLSVMEVNFVGCGPKKTWPKKKFMDVILNKYKENNVSISFTRSLGEASKNTNIFCIGKLDDDYKHLYEVSSDKFSECLKIVKLDDIDTLNKIFILKAIIYLLMN